jgi:hypothetical protein
MAQLLSIALALPLALVCGGRLGRISSLRLRGLPLFFLAFGIQVVAFPFAFLPWTTGEDAATALDVVIASGAFVLVFAATGARLPFQRLQPSS